MSTNFIDFLERSMANELLGNTFDRGVMVYGSPTQGFNYSLAYVNGIGGTADENNAKNDGQDLTIRGTFNIYELLSWPDGSKCCWSCYYSCYYSMRRSISERLKRGC